MRSRDRVLVTDGASGLAVAVVSHDSAAASIATPDGGGDEPWVSVVDAEGRIVVRWDDVLHAAEPQQLLEDVPPDPETS